MGRYLPADIHNTAFQTGRTILRVGGETASSFVAGVGLAKSAYAIGKLGYNALRIANNSKWIRQSLRFCSSDLKRVDRGLRLNNSKTLFNFTDVTAQHMNEFGRRVPIHILDDVIKSPIVVAKAPKGASNAMMHYSQIWRNGKFYNVEGLCCTMLAQAA